MKNVTFITGNQSKADFLAKYLDDEIKHEKIDLDELQSLDLQVITEHKAKQAYKKINSPVLVEDVSFVINALGQLPGPLIKWFEQSLGLEGICQLVDKLGNREAVARVCFAFYDGELLKFFNGEVAGLVTDRPMGADGFGWNSIFIPHGVSKTYAQMDEDELRKHSLRTTTVYPQIRQFLVDLDKK